MPTLQEKLEAVFEEQYSSAVADLRAWWDGNVHHGCFCGAGSRCTEAIDGLDACCQQHDVDYSAVQQSADTMWTINGFILCHPADAALAASATSATLKPDDPHSSPDVEAFRDNLVWLFSNRAAIGAALHAWRDRLQRLEDAWNNLGRYLSASWTPLTEGDAEVMAGAQQHVDYLRSLDATDADIVDELAAQGFDATAVQTHLLA